MTCSPIRQNPGRVHFPGRRPVQVLNQAGHESEAKEGAFAAFTVPVLPGAVSAYSLAVEAAFGVMAAAPLIVRRRWPVLVVFVVAAVYVALVELTAALTSTVSMRLSSFSMSAGLTK